MSIDTSEEIPKAPVRTYRQLREEISKLEREARERPAEHERLLAQKTALRWAAGLDTEAPSESLFPMP